MDATQKQQDAVIDVTGTYGRVQVMGGVFDMAELCALAQLGVSGLQPDAVVADVGGMVVYTDTGGAAPVAFVAELEGNRVAVRADAMDLRQLCRAAAAVILKAGPVARLGTTARIRDRLMMLAMER